MNAYRRTLTTQGIVSVDWLLTDIGSAAETYEDARANGRHDDTLDPAIPCLDFLCRCWSAELGRFHVVHDVSGVTDRNLDLFRAMDQLDDPRHPGLKLPHFPVDRFTFADSRKVPQLQIADWVAGAVGELAKDVVLRRDCWIESDLQEHLMQWVTDSMFSIAEDNRPF